MSLGKLKKACCRLSGDIVQRSSSEGTPFYKVKPRSRPQHTISLLRGLVRPCPGVV